MSFEIRRRIVIGALGVFLVWPLVHHVIVRNTEFSAWKGAGWSMYCQPMRAVGVAVVLPGDAKTLDTSRLALAERSSVEEALGDFQKRRSHFGRWVKPDALARAVLEALDVDRIRIDIGQAVVDPKTSISVSEGSESYEYSRADFGLGAGTGS